MFSIPHESHSKIIGEDMTYKGKENTDSGSIVIKEFMY